MKNSLEVYWHMSMFSTLEKPRQQDLMHVQGEPSIYELKADVG